VDSVPLGRKRTFNETAKGASFLASDESSYVTGIEPVIDGGVTQILMSLPVGVSMRSPWTQDGLIAADRKPAAFSMPWQPSATCPSGTSHPATAAETFRGE